MKVKIFYGWYIVLASLALSAGFSAISTYGWTAFVNPIAAAFGWSMAQMSLASSFSSLESGVFSPLWGLAVDRWSPRKMMLIGVFSIGLGMLVLSRTTNLAIYYLGFFVMGVGSSLVTLMVPSVVISRWFKKDIGKANGLFWTGVGLGGVMVPVIVMLIDRWGWQNVLLYAGIAFLVAGIPLSWVFRSRPQDYGQVPDGRAVPVSKRNQKVANYDFSTSVKQVIRMRAFWYLNVVTLFQSAVLGTVSLYVIPYLTNLGMDRAAAGLVVSIFTIISLCARMPLGMLVDVFRKKYVIAVTIGLTGVGLFLFWLMDAQAPLWLKVLFGLTYGIGISGIMPTRLPILVEYFGNRNIGTISGISLIASTIGGVSAAPIAGWVFDTYGNYKPVWLFLVCFAVIAIVLMLSMPASRRPQSTVAEKGIPGTN